ncbi:MAG: DUF4129 domain-containing protein [Steroidobacteraceae bacterium]
MSRRATIGSWLILSLAGSAAAGVAQATDDLRTLDASFAACLAIPSVALSDSARPPSPPVSLQGRGPQAGKNDEKPAPPGLATVCPDLVAAVAASEFGRLLPDDWDDVISTGRLNELRATLAASAPPAKATTLAADSLHDILAKMEAEQQHTPPTLWQRFKNWLKSLFERQKHKGESESWINWLARHVHLSVTAGKIINYALLLLLLGAAIAIVVVELRAAGILTSAGRETARRRAAAAIAGRARLTLADVAAAPLAERPTLLVLLLIERCVATGRLRERSSLTHRELQRAARFEAPADRDAFSAVIHSAEAVRFAGQAPDEQALERAVREGQALLARLGPGAGAAA